MCIRDRALENAVEEAVEAKRQVYVVGARGTTRRRLEKLGLYRKIATDHIEIELHEALDQAVSALKPV